MTIGPIHETDLFLSVMYYGFRAFCSHVIALHCVMQEFYDVYEVKVVHNICYF